MKMMGDDDVTLSEQLTSATDINAVFCIACGQPDEGGLHDPARCPAMGGTRDHMTVADALAVFDQSCVDEPDLEDNARALHCAILAREGAGVLEQSNADEGISMLREANASFGNYTATAPGVPELGDFDRDRLKYWAGILDGIATGLKLEAAEANGTGREMLGLLLIRLQLSVEETGEFAEALAEGDLVHAAKELADMSYVTDGHYLTLGLGDLKLPLYREVHRSNMTKLDPETGKPIINEAGRWVKGPAYEEADVARVLEAK